MEQGFEVELLLHTDLETATRMLGDELGLLTPTGDGVLWRAQTGCLGWFASQLVRLPYDFEIISPAALKDELRGHAEKLLAMTAV